MIMIWNRREVYVGTSLQDLSEVRSILASNKIKYNYRVVNRNSSNVIGSQRARTGTFGQNLNVSNTYYVYVNKKDYDDACGLLHKMK